MSLLVPAPEKPAKEDELAYVVGVMVGDEEGFAEKVLALAPAEGFVEIGRGFLDEGDEGLEIAMDGGDGLIPGVSGWWLWGFGPIAVGPLDGMIAAGGRRGEVEDVALGDAEMFEKLPGGVREVGRDCAVEAGGEIFNSLIEGGVSLAFLKKIAQLFAQRRLFVCGVLRLFFLGGAHGLLVLPNLSPNVSLLDAARARELQRFMAATNDEGQIFPSIQVLFLRYKRILVQQS
jgi:hypothetical protein